MQTPHANTSKANAGPTVPFVRNCGLINQAYKLTPKPGSKSAVRKGVWKCKGCRKQFAVTVGSIFRDTHIPLHKWLLAIHLVASSKKRISAHQLMRNLELGSYRSAWFIAHRIPWALTREPMTEMLGGIVELDETYIGGKRREHVPQATKPGVRPKDNPGPFGGKAAVVSVLQRGDSVRSHHIKPIIEEVHRALARGLGFAGQDDLYGVWRIARAGPPALEP